jgi:hypothetical protein
MKTLILNSNNIVSGSGNSQFIYKFPSSVTFKNNLIGVASISQFFSTYNVNATNYNNNKYSYVWFDGVTYSVNMPNGYYTINNLLTFLQNTMIQNNHFLVTSTGSNVYFLSFAANQTYYSTQLYSYVLDTAIATTNDWTLPPGATWSIPAVPTVSQFMFGSNNFCYLFGFTPNYTWPATQTGFSSVQSVLSSQAPQINPFNSFLVYCSLVQNLSTIPSNLLYTYTPQNVTFGAIESYVPPYIGFNRVSDGTYNQFEIVIRDQLFNAISFEDPQTVITLFIKDADEHY